PLRFDGQHCITPRHFTMFKTLKKAVMFKRYIDDIIWISESVEITNQIQKELSETFLKNGLKMTFRRISTRQTSGTLEFLDVNHVVDPSCAAGFRTTNFVKPTAINRLFLNGQSSHPRNVFKSIFFSESIRMRRLNEKTDDYLKALEDLKIKCWKSGFDKKMVNNMLNIARSWKDRFAPPNGKNKPIDQRVVWATCFPSLLRLSKREIELNKDAVVVYKRPQIRGNKLLRYRGIAHNIKSSLLGASSPCNRCKLCGKFGKSANMVNSATSITSMKGKSFTIKRSLNCSDWGIYVATCAVCSHQYVGQTSTKFSARWNTHRATWRHGAEDEGDKAALLKHFKKNHPDYLGRELSSAFTVTFVDRPSSPKNLDLLESKWINRLEATINIQKTVLPRIT
ncbi:MAG: GIY-YIG nuclease family protein, partial [Pseudomonadota bacterium]|nr:GIY-YIG nuclease family protein [Pseudomonadota bacterium]